MQIYSLVGLAVVACALIMLLRRHQPEFALLAAVVAAGIILFMVVGQTSDIINQLTALCDDYGINSDNIRLLIKSLGISYITMLAADTCRDSGESAIAGKIELAGKISIVAMCVPLVVQLLGIIGEMLG